MTDFVIVIATAAQLAVPALLGAGAEAPPVPAANAPTVGFLTYHDAGSCEAAAQRLVTPAGRRLVCVPVEPDAGEMASAY